MDMARILLTASSSSVPRVMRAARALAKRGHEVSVLEWDRGGDLPEEEVRDGITFIRYRRRSGYGKKAALNMIGWLIFQLSFLLSEDFDLIQPQNLDSLLPTYVALRILRDATFNTLFPIVPDSLLMILLPFDDVTKMIIL
jgi:hypothetical protein